MTFFRVRRQTTGQVLVEMAVSMVGVVMFTYVVLKVWTWMSASIIGRQAEFQSTRIDAGQMDIENGDIPGQPVNFVPPMLQIVGAPGATSPGTGGTPYPPLIGPPCVPGNPDVRAAQLLMDEGDAHMANYNTLMGQVDVLNQLVDLWLQMQALQVQIDQLVNIDIPAIQAAIATGYADLAVVQSDLATANAALTACLALPPPPMCAAEQAAVDALVAQEAALQTQIANDEATEASLQAQLLALQNQMLLLQAQFDALVAGAGFAVDLSSPPASLLAQRDVILANANAELVLANDAYDRARELMNSGVPGCQ